MARKNVFNAKEQKKKKSKENVNVKGKLEKARNAITKRK
jgi:hypothetical protein